MKIKLISIVEDWTKEDLVESIIEFLKECDDFPEFTPENWQYPDSWTKTDIENFMQYDNESFFDEVFGNPIKDNNQEYFRVEIEEF